MDKALALAILGKELAAFREKSYSELVSMIDREPNQSEERSAPSGALYYVEMQVFWDDKPGGDVRVMGSIDDGGLRAFVPLSVSFVMGPSGVFVGE
jgi:hypothetical protein